MNNLPSICLVDTNVVIAANGTELLDEEQHCCIAPCVEVLENIKRGKCKLVLDESQEIIKEYQNKLDTNRQKGPGVAFIKWAWSNSYNPSKVDLVPITSDGDSYKEFPQHSGLKTFDLSDRKFIAAANAHQEKPTIAQALDSKWCRWEAALKEVGLSVYFVHEEYIRAKYAEYASQME